MILDFFNSAAGLKGLPRQGWVEKLNHKNPETVAEHTYLAAVMGMVFSDMKGMNTAKVLSMTLLHDLAESSTGDITPTMMPRDSKSRLEDASMREILELLPERLRDRYLAMWNEFRHGASAEARLVRQIDRLEMALQASRYLKDGHTPEQLESFFDSAQDGITEKDIRETLANVLNDR